MTSSNKWHIQIPKNDRRRRPSSIIPSCVLLWINQRLNCCKSSTSSVKRMKCWWRNYVRRKASSSHMSYLKRQVRTLFRLLFFIHKFKKLFSFIVNNKKARISQRKPVLSDRKLRSCSKVRKAQRRLKWAWAKSIWENEAGKTQRDIRTKMLLHLPNFLFLIFSALNLLFSLKSFYPSKHAQNEEKLQQTRMKTYTKSRKRMLKCISISEIKCN